MRRRIVLAGSSKGLTVALKKTLEDSGFEARLSLEKAKGLFSMKDPAGVFIIEARGETDIDDIKKAVSPGEGAAKPFLIFAPSGVSDDDASVLKGAGLLGVITGKSSPEDVIFMVNRAVFFSESIRRKPRAPVNIPLTVRYGGKTVKTTSSQLSRDGMFIVTLNPFEVNAELEIEFRLPGADKGFETRAKVLYRISINKELNIISSPNDPFKRLVTHPGMAVFFVDLPDDDRGAIDKYIETL